MAMNPYEAKIHELETAAQRAGEDRMELAHDSLDENYEVDELAGPYCGCITCDVREVLAAAWPYLKELALVEAEVEGRVWQTFLEEGAVPVLRDSGSVKLAHGVVPKDD